LVAKRLRDMVNFFLCNLAADAIVPPAGFL
jgi:hypothetical protein